MESVQPEGGQKVGRDAVWSVWARGGGKGLEK